jgi:hypothetical protein
MGFFRRAKDGLGIVQTGLEVSREQQRNMPTTTEEMNARMEAMIAKQEAGAARAQRVQRLATSGVDTLATLRAVAFNQQPTFLEAILEWTVQPSGGAPYDARSADAVRAELASSLVRGAQCTVKVDPSDRKP